MKGVFNWVGLSPSMNYNYYIGLDISKLTIDCTILKGGEFFLHEQINNTAIDIKEWLKRVMKEHKAGGRKSLFCAETSGPYTIHVVKVLVKKKLPLWMENALQIHLTLGLQRGKSDKIDSLRIAQYAYTYHARAKLYQKPREVIDHLKYLRTLRLKLLNTINKLKAMPKELALFKQNKLSESLLLHCHESLVALQKDLIKVDGKILDLIKEDQHLKQLHFWLTSVPSIGDVLATEMLIATNEFKNFNSAKKFACYCGIAPFRYTSGTSVQSRAKVSKRANKKMKYLLHMAAMSAIQLEGDFKTYYKRRLAVGYSKMSVINAVRNKIILRAFACIREERPYSKAKITIAEY